MCGDLMDTISPGFRPGVLSRPDILTEQFDNVLKIRRTLSGFRKPIIFWRKSLFILACVGLSVLTE